MFCFFKQKTAYELRISDWSSDVCSSDLDEGESALLSAHPADEQHAGRVAERPGQRAERAQSDDPGTGTKHDEHPDEADGDRRPAPPPNVLLQDQRSEERREGEACADRCRSRVSR